MTRRRPLPADPLLDRLLVSTRADARADSIADALVRALLSTATRSTQARSRARAKARAGSTELTLGSTIRAFAPERAHKAQSTGESILERFSEQTA